MQGHALEEKLADVQEQCAAVTDAMATLSAASNCEAHRNASLEEHNKLLLDQNSEMQVTLCLAALCELRLCYCSRFQSPNIKVLRR